jgi:hypothetical protein
MTPKETVLAIPDLQVPFQHRDSYDFLSAVNEAYEPTQIVCIGDEVDFHALSDYESDPDGFSAGDELQRSIDALAPLYEMFPKVKSCISNHTMRPFKRAFKAGIPRRLLRDYGEFLEAPPGWRWDEYWEIDGIRYEHGHNLVGGGKYMNAKAPEQNGRSTVFGHFHSFAGVQYVSTPEALMFGMNVGCLIDMRSYAFAYAKNSKTRPILGCGVVDEGIPLFVPMLVNKKNEWVGELIGT